MDTSGVCSIVVRVLGDMTTISWADEPDSAGDWCIYKKTSRWGWVSPPGCPSNRPEKETPEQKKMFYYDARHEGKEHAKGYAQTLEAAKIALELSL